MVTRKLPTKQRRATDAPKVQVMWRVSPEGRKVLKTLAVQTDQTLQDLLDEAVSDLMRKYRKPWAESKK
jgi:hypothetical protein